MQWSASVSAFGMLLRDSKYKGNLNYTTTIKMAQNAKGKDVNGLRSEMIQLMKSAQNLSPASVK